MAKLHPTLPVGKPCQQHQLIRLPQTRLGSFKPTSQQHPAEPARVCCHLVSATSSLQSAQRRTSRCQAQLAEPDAELGSRDAALSQIEQAASQTENGIVRVSLPTKSLLTSLRMGRQADGMVIIDEVESNSDLAEAGLKPGMLVMAISDPIRRGTMWELDRRSSLRMVLHTLRFQHGTEVQIDLKAGSNAAAPPSPSSRDDASSISPLLQSGNEGAAEAQPNLDAGPDRELAALRRRQKRRQEYMEQTSPKNSKFLVTAAAVVLIPPALILAAALQSGYIEQLGSVYRGRY